MEASPFSLSDLIPKETEFELSPHPGRKFVLCRWTLRVRAWAVEKYGPEKLKQIFEQQMIGEIAELAWFMLKDQDKQFFKNSKDEFLDGISSVQDQVNIIMALLGAVGIGEPELDKIKESQKKSQTP